MNNDEQFTFSPVKLRLEHREIIRVTMPPWLCVFLGCTVWGAVHSSPDIEERNFKTHMMHNAFIRTAGNIAVVTWLRSLGLSAQMFPICDDPDQCADVQIENLLGKLALEVKTSLMSGGRGFKSMREYNREIPDVVRNVQFDWHVSAICLPNFFGADPLVVDIVAVFPAALVAHLYAGMLPRMLPRAIPAGIGSTAQFASSLLDEMGAQGSLKDPLVKPQTLSATAVLGLPWVVENLFGGQSPLAVDDDKVRDVMALAEFANTDGAALWPWLNTPAQSVLLDYESAIVELI